MIRQESGISCTKREITAYLEKDSVSAEQLKLLHGLGVKRNHRVVIVHSLVHDQSVRALLAVKDSCAEILLVLCLAAMVQVRGERVNTTGVCDVTTRSCLITRSPYIVAIPKSPLASDSLCISRCSSGGASVSHYALWCVLSEE